MKKVLFAVLASLAIPSLTGLKAQPAPGADSILRIMERVADWQLHNWDREGMHWPKWDWTNGAAYTGFLALNQVANDPKYIHFLHDMGEDVGWNTGPRRTFADDYCVGQTFSALYSLYDQPEMISKFKTLADSIASAPHTESLEWKNNIQLREWAWCDALFMGPPSLAFLSTATHDMKYINTAVKLWWKTTDYLFDSTENLYFRDSRYFDQKESNGKKVFWSRGNGWVMAGLVRMLENMPADYPGRDRFVNLYQRMAAKIASIQCDDGSWHASLLDPDSYPVKETSGTGFFCYALAYGVNHGLISYEKYFPVIERAWNALSTSVQSAGKLGFVQPVGAAPDVVNANSTEVYGVGAFLLSGAEIIKLQLKHSVNKNILVIGNSISTNRDEVVAEMDYSDFVKKISPKNNQFRITNALTGTEIPYQLEYKGNKNPQKILMLVNLSPGSRIYATVTYEAPDNFEPGTYGRFVPERYDDFAWENDKIAFRVYGKALEKTNENAYGHDVWAKRTSKLIINKWYKGADYHVDHGEGLDFYEVGFSLGDGSNAPFVNDSIYYSKNFVTEKVLDNGPLRSTFQLGYDEWDVNGRKVKETKTISLDAGSQMNKVETVYTFAGKENMPIVVGIVKRQGKGVMLLNEQKGIMGYWEPKQGKDGTLGTGVLVPQKDVTMRVKDKHLLSVTEVENEKPYMYYYGAAWNKAGRITDAKQWFDYLKDYRRNLENPIIVHWF